MVVPDTAGTYREGPTLGYGGSGGSLAAPQVSAVAALLKSALVDRYPGRTLLHEEIEALIKAGAEACTNQGNVPNDTCGYGFVRADRSIQYTQPPWHWFRSKVTGRDLVTALSPKAVFVWTDGSGDSLMAEGMFIGTPHAIEKTVSLPRGTDLPVVSGIGESPSSSMGYRTLGWANPSTPDSVQALYQDFFCEVIDVDTGEATLCTYLWCFTEEVVDTGTGPFIIDVEDFWMPVDTTAQNEWYFSYCIELDSGTATVLPAGSPNGTESSRSRIVAVRPSPSNPIAMIDYYLAEGTRAVIHVYNVAGRLVREVPLGAALSSGHHMATWDGRDSSGRDAVSGVYFVVLQTEEKQDMRRFVLVR